MNVKEQIFKALELYKKGEYTTEIFCDVFTSLYYYETSGCNLFKGNEKKYLDELAMITSRFSKHEEDLKKYPSTYFSESMVIERFNEIYLKLNL